MPSSWSPVSFFNVQAQAPVVLICEHASNHIPDDFDQLGLEDDALNAHIAWDIGALKVAIELSRSLDAPLVFGGVSRLLYDCNRPLNATDCIPEVSEIYRIPGNAGLSDSAKLQRHQLIHDPFHQGVEKMIETQARRNGAQLSIITIHSFTPEYHGKPRECDIGFIHHSDQRLSQDCLESITQQSSYKSSLNEPYDASDGVTYSLCRHGDTRQYPSTMIEIKNSLIDTSGGVLEIAGLLAQVLQSALVKSAEDDQ